MADLKLRITVDPETGKLVAFNDELGKMPGAAAKASDGMANSFLKAAVVMEGLKFGIGKAVDGFKQGMAEIEKDAAGMARLQGAADAMLVPFQKLVDVTNQISSDNLIDFASASQSIANITQAGLGADLEKVAVGLKDIAAAAGGNVGDNLETLSTALLTGRINGAELQKMLPSLRSEMDKLPKAASDAEKQQALLNAILKDSATQAGAAQTKLGELSGKTQQLANDSDDLKKAWAEGVLKGFEGSGSIIGDTHKNMTELQTGVSGLATVLTVTLVAAFKALKGAVDIAMIPLNSMVEWFIAAPGVVNQFRTELMSIAKSFDQFGAGLVTAIQAGIQQRWDSMKGWFKGKLQDLRNLLPSSDAKEGPLSTLTAAGVAFWTTMAAGMSAAEGVVISSIKDTLGKVMGVFDALGKAIGGTFGKAVDMVLGGIKAIGQAMSGDWLGAITTAIQSLGAAIAGLFSHDWKKDVNDMVGGLGLSADLLEQLAGDAEKFGNAAVATWENLSEIISEVGTDAIPLLRDGFSYLEQGIITTSQLIEGLESNFQTLADASMDSFGVISAEMQEIIDLAEAFGLEIEAIAQFMDAQFTAGATALTELIEQWAGSLPEDADILGIHALLDTRADARDFMTLLMAQMNEMIAQGMSLHEVFTMLGPAITTLRDAAVDLGLKSDPAFKSFFALFRVMKTEGAATLSNINTLMTSFANLGILNQKTFDSLQGILDDVFKKFNADGKISKAEMIAMLPTLAQMRAMAEQYGLTLDDATQAMIDLAISRGLLPEEMPIDPMVDFANVIRDDLIPAIKDMTAGINAFITAVGGIPPVIGTTVQTTYTGAPATGGDGKIPTGGFGGKVTTQSGSTSGRLAAGVINVALYPNSTAVAKMLIEVQQDGTMSAQQLP